MYVGGGGGGGGGDGGVNRYVEGEWCIHNL